MYIKRKKQRRNQPGQWKKQSAWNESYIRIVIVVKRQCDKMRHLFAYEYLFTFKRFKPSVVVFEFKTFQRSCRTSCLSSTHFEWLPEVYHAQRVRPSNSFDNRLMYRVIHIQTRSDGLPQYCIIFIIFEYYRYMTRYFRVAIVMVIFKVQIRTSENQYYDCRFFIRFSSFPRTTLSGIRLKYNSFFFLLDDKTLYLRSLRLKEHYI